MKKTAVLISALLLFMWGCSNSDINFTYSDKDSYFMNDGGGTGTGGSMARFTIVGDHLFTVDGMHLKTFNISNESKIEMVSSWQLDWSNGIETIFPYQNKLFLGTTTGMHIIDISNPEKPSYISKYEHVVSCDPVVVQGDYAYVTLRSGESWCWRSVNQLEVIDLSDIQNPEMLKTWPMTNPKGLGIDGNLLFVCDEGLKVFEIQSPTNLVQINHFENIGETFDVIPYNGILILIGEQGFRQYSYENGSLTELGSILVSSDI